MMMRRSRIRAEKLFTATAFAVVSPGDLWIFSGDTVDRESEILLFYHHRGICIYYEYRVFPMEMSRWILILVQLNLRGYRIKHLKYNLCFHPLTDCTEK